MGGLRLSLVPALPLSFFFRFLGIYPSTKDQHQILSRPWTVIDESALRGTIAETLFI